MKTATEKQVNFLRNLVNERQAKRNDGTFDETQSVADVLKARGVDVDAWLADFERRTWRDASDVIDKLVAAPKLPKKTAPAFKVPDVPAGHYATPSRTGNNDLDFWRVDRPTKGKWAGRTFVKRVIGGHPDTNVRGKEQVEALQAILDLGVDVARQTYGSELGQCARCNRHLTDELSRARGIGPDCWTREGWNYDDSELVYTLTETDEDAEALDFVPGWSDWVATK